MKLVGCIGKIEVGKEVTPHVQCAEPLCDRVRYAMNLQELLNSWALFLLPRPHLRPSRPLSRRDSLSACCRHFALGLRRSTFGLRPSRFLREADPPATRSRHGVMTTATQLAKNRKSRINMPKLSYQIRSHCPQFRRKAR